MVTKPWAGVRELFGGANLASVPGQSIRDLLNDADALLAFMRESMDKEPQLELTESYKALPEKLK